MKKPKQLLHPGIESKTAIAWDFFIHIQAQNCFISSFKVRSLYTLKYSNYAFKSFAKAHLMMLRLWKLLIGCILSHISNTLLPCVTSWETQKKSAKISRKELQTSTSLVHPWIQFPDAWRCHVHLFKQLYASINKVGMSSHRTAQEGDGFCVPEMMRCFGAKCVYQLQNRSKTPFEDAG